MARSRFVVAVLWFLLFAQAASGDCLTPVWESRSPTPSNAGRTILIVGDFDGDGIADTVFVRSDYPFGDTVALERGKGNGFFATPVDIYTAPQLRGFQQAMARDLDRDGKLDLLLLEELRRLVFLPGNGDGTFGSPVFSPVSTGPDFTMADMNGDDVDDVVAFYFNDSGVGLVVYLGGLAGNFVETTKTPFSLSPRSIATGDLDGDGANDVVAGIADGTKLDLLFGKDNGTFHPPVTLANGESRDLTTTMLADLENDGDLDIVAVSDLEYVAVHRNRGGRTFDPVVIHWVSEPYTSIRYAHYATVADVTGDGELDLLVATSSNGLATLRGLGDGTFDYPRFELFSGSKATWAPVGTTDFDGDGRVDVLIGQNGFSGLRALRNRCGDVDVFLTATPPADPAAHNVTVHVTTGTYNDGDEEPAPAHATGTVTILEGLTVLATGTLSDGKVTLNVRGLTLGAHKLVAQYSGDAQYEPTQSARILVQVPMLPATPPPPRRRAVRP